MLMDELREQCLSCRACGLADTRTNVVFGTGDVGADILFVGEGPGKNEDLSGVPFVGKAGQLLDLYLEAVGIERSRVYITNIVKCRPPQNRDPSPQEQEACIGYLREQFKIISPKLVVCLGRIAAQQLISPDFRITKEHGRMIRKGNTVMTATFHPAALLRNPDYKADTLEDFKAIARYTDNSANVR